ATSLRLPMQKQRHFSIAGKVKNLGSNRGGQLVLSRILSLDSTFPVNALDPYDGSLRVGVDPDGTFSYPDGLPPNEYWAGFAPAGEVRGGTLFKIQTKDLHDIQIDLIKGFTFAGKVVWEDGTPAQGLSAEMRTFWLRRTIYTRGLGTDEKGAFTS